MRSGGREEYECVVVVCVCGWVGVCVGGWMNNVGDKHGMVLVGKDTH